MNINQLYKYIGAISEQIPLVHSYSNKSVYDYWDMDEVKYGSVCFSVQNVSAGSHTTTYTGVLYYGDRLMEDRSNIESVYSDATLTLQTIMNTLSNSDDVEVSFPIQITYFEQAFADQLAGAYANLTITVEGVGQCGFDGTILPTPIYPGEDGFDAENYYTKSQVDALLDRYDAIVDEKLEEYAKDTDLASYVTKTELEEKHYIDHIPANLVTESELNETLDRKGYLTSIPDGYITARSLDEKLQRDGYTTKSQVNELLDGYVSESELAAQDYATKDYVSQRVANVEDTLTGFASKSYVDAAVDKCVTESELVNQDFASKEYVRQQVANVENDLAGYATKSYVDAEIDNCVTESELVNQDFASKEYVRQQVANVEVDLSGYATKSYVDAEIDNCVTESELVNQDFASKEYVRQQVANVEVDLSGYATKSYVDAEIDKIQAGDVDLSDYYTKTESDNRFATNAYVDEKVANVTVDLTGYATEAYVNNLVGKINEVLDSVLNDVDTESLENSLNSILNEI